MPAEELRVGGETDVDHAVLDCGGRIWVWVWICGRDGGRDGGDCWIGDRNRDGDEGGVVDAVAVYFADVEVGLYGFYVGVGDVVGGAVDLWGGGFGGLWGGGVGG